MPNVLLPTFNPPNPVSYPNQTSLGAHEPFALLDHRNASAGPGLYSDNPWYRLDTLAKDQELTQMEMAYQYKMTAFWNQFAPYVVQMQGTERLTWQEVFPMEANLGEIGARQIWLPTQTTDTRSMSMTYKTYGSKVAINRYDDAVKSAYTLSGAAGLWPMAKMLLSQSVNAFLEYHIRNSYLQSVYNTYMGTNWATRATHPMNGGTGFASLLRSNSAAFFDPSVIEMVIMELAGRGVDTSSMFAITTPEVMMHMKSRLNGSPLSAAGSGSIAAWREKLLYAGAVELMRQEMGEIYGVRFLQHDVNVLRNSGTILTQGTPTTNYYAGDGAWNGKVDDQWEVGQTNVRHWIDVNGATLVPSGGAYVDAAINVGDIVTIHQRRVGAAVAPSNAPYLGVLNGVPFMDDTISHRRVVAVTNNIPDIDHPRANLPGIAFDMPLQKDYTGTTYITKAEDIHPVIFVANPRAVVMAVSQPPQFMTPPPIDDRLAIYRYSWDAIMLAQTIMPEAIQVVWCAAPKTVSVVEPRA